MEIHVKWCKKSVIALCLLNHGQFKKLRATPKTPAYVLVSLCRYSSWVR